MNIWKNVNLNSAARSPRVSKPNLRDDDSSIVQLDEVDWEELISEYFPFTRLRDPNIQLVAVEPTGNEFEFILELERQSSSGERRRGTCGLDLSGYFVGVTEDTMTDICSSLYDAMLGCCNLNNCCWG